MSFSLYTAKAVANSILKICQERNILVTNMKLQKLIFFAQSWYIKLYGKVLFTDPIERWSYGPVIPTVYYEFNCFGKAPISCFAVDAMGLVPFIKPESEAKETWAFLERIVEVYGNIDALKLSEMTHAEGTAWSRGKLRTTISLKDMMHGAV